MTEEEFAQLSAGHALHALSPADAVAYRAVLAEHPEWQAKAEADRRAAALLAETVEDAAPPAEIRAALLAHIARGPQPVVDASGQDASSVRLTDVSRGNAAPVARRRWTRGIFALAASLVVLLGLTFGALQLSGVFSPPPAVTALEQIQRAPDAQQAEVAVTDGGTATAHWSALRGEAVLVADGMAALPTDRTYELWFVRSGGAVPAGTFDVAAGGATTLLDGAMQPGDVIAVTVEPAGGSPTGVPTSTPILAIPTV